MKLFVILSVISLFNIPDIYGEEELEDLSPIISIAQGQVQGTIKYTPEERLFYAFQGIPFGKPPVGSLRFQPPEAASAWNGVLQATFDPPPCLQLDVTINSTTYGSEDCLQLNVYTPQLPNNASNPLLPVHVYIHGGSFISGGIDYGDVNPERYMNLDMVVVPIKYRLGPLGFLSTNDAAASGNPGLLDQNLALQWVRDNIAAFGGNPNDVTLTGQSAGSACAMFHYQSPMSAGLFHRVIAESGSSVCPWY